MKNLYLKSTLSVAIALALSACSGDGGNGAGSGPSGSLMSGTVTKFGSVFVNGVRFDTSVSSFDINGVPGTQGNLDIGMVVNVEGSVSDDGSGSAVNITFDAQLQGPVSGLTLAFADATKKLFTVLGTTVSVSSEDTVFAISGQGAIAPGTLFDLENMALRNNVQVSGFFDDSGVLHATRIELKAVTFDATSMVELKGNISVLSNTSFGINGVAVDASAALLDDLPQGLENGIRVEVKGTFDVATNTLTALSVEAELDQFNGVAKAHIEGMITDFVSSVEFKINGHLVDASAAMMTPSTLLLVENLRIEVEGQVINGVLHAATVELRGGEDKVHAQVSSIDMANDSFMMMPVVGQPEIKVKVTSSTEMRDDVDKVHMLNVGDLVVGDFAEVRGFVDGAAITATRVRVRDNKDVIVQGVQQNSSGSGFVKVHGVEFAIVPLGETGFENGNDIDITQAEFNLAAQGNVNTIIKIRDRQLAVGAAVGNGIADAVEIEVPNNGNGLTFINTDPPIVILPGTPAGATSNFIGVPSDLTGLVADFVNASVPTSTNKVGRPRLDIVIADVPRALFTGTGDNFGDTGRGLGEQDPPNLPGTIGAGDEAAVDRFTAVFSDRNNRPIRIFGSDNVQIIAQEILGPPITARQDVVWVMFSIRFGDVATLAGSANVEIFLDDTILLSSASITGDMDLSDATNVAFSNVVQSFPAPAPVDPAPVDPAPVDPAPAQ